MKLFGRLSRKADAQPRVEPVLDSAAAEKSVQNAMTPEEFSEWVRGVSTSAGVHVSEQTVMNISAVYACVGLIGGSIAQVPLPIFEKNGDERTKVDHEYSHLLNVQPHEMYSAATFWESFVGSELLNGDGFARIIRPSRFSPNIVGFDWYKKSEVEVKKDGKWLIYLLTRDNKTEVVTSDDMIHVPGPGFDGKNGMSQIKHALKTSGGIALAADQFSSKYFENGSRPDIALEVPVGKLDSEQKDLIQSSWSDRYAGVNNSHKPAIMSGGMKIHELTINAEDAQLISTRKFQVEDIARIFGVPPHMIGHTESSTSWGSGVEQMSIGFVKYTLARHLTKIEQELNRKLFRGKPYFAEFNTAGLERGDYKTRMEGYRIGLGRAGEPAFMTVNEVRKLENLPPIDGGNVLFNGVTNESTTQATGTE